jgi:hypothetical protein
MIILILAILPFLAHAAESPYRFVEMKSYKEDPSLPPNLTVNFDVDCGDEFVKVIREEITNPKTGLTQIAIGGMVKSNPQSPCVGTFRDKAVEAGSTFSGREYEIVKILKESHKTMFIKSSGQPTKKPSRNKL